MHSRSVRTRPKFSKGVTTGESGSDPHNNPLWHQGRLFLAMKAPRESDTSRISFHARLPGATMAFMHDLQATISRCVVSNSLRTPLGRGKRLRRIWRNRALGSPEFLYKLAKTSLYRGKICLLFQSSVLGELALR